MKPLALLPILCALLGGVGTAYSEGSSSPPDTASPVFKQDSTKASVIRSIEAGKTSTDTAMATAARTDSLEVKLRHRGAFIGVTGAVSFGDHSAKTLFSDYMNSTASANGQRIVEPQDPVHVSFPVGLVAGFPVFPYLDLWLRTEHFWYRVNGLAQKDNEATREFWYANQGHLAGVGARYHVPVSLLSLNDKPGLYMAYTRFWNFGPTGIYAPTGSLRAKTDPAGAGYEIQIGVQQDFSRRWTFTGGLAYTSLDFESAKSWRTILPTAPDEQARWNLKSARFCLQGLYQFGR